MAMFTILTLHYNSHGMLQVCSLQTTALMTRRSCQTVPKQHKNLVVVRVPKALTILDNG